MFKNATALMAAIASLSFNSARGTPTMSLSIPRGVETIPRWSRTTRAAHPHWPRGRKPRYTKYRKQKRFLKDR